jgi:hypothetical protein
MNNLEHYLELIQKLTLRLTEAEVENVMLKEKLSKCEGKLEVLNQFYLDFKDSDRSTSVEKPNYDELLSQYFVSKDVSIIEHLFEDYDVSAAQILTDIRILSNIKNALPENIEDITKKYGCEAEYQIIKKSLEHIENFKESLSYSERGIHDLSDTYIKKYMEGKKKAALRYLKQALVYYPFQLQVFLDNINEYRDENLIEYVENLKYELYGKGNMLLVDKDYKVKSTKVDELLVVDKTKPILFKRPRKPRESKFKNKNDTIIKKKELGLGNNDKILEYLKVPVPELVEMVRTHNIKNQRLKAIRIYSYMERLHRSDDDCFFFLEGVNKFLTKKI